MGRITNLNEELSARERNKYRKILKRIVEIEKEIKKLKAEKIPAKDTSGRWEKNRERIEDLERELRQLEDQEDRYRPYA